ncbi:MATE family efflux transporter [candidate division WOR-3 bacterium]|nr:MATE family efflux transporter [candidate division WOR-3 bacterium]
MKSRLPASSSPRVSRSEQMGTQPIGKLLLQFSLPGVIAMLVNATYNIVDTIFVGGLGHEAIAALTVVFPIQMIIVAVGSGTGIGASSLISRRLGAGFKGEANQVVGQTLGISLILGFCVALLGWGFGKPLLRVMGASDLIINDSFAYLSIIASGAVFTFTNMTGNNLVRAEGNPILPMISMISGAVINIGLDPVFIYTLGLGVRGAAIATVLAQVIVSIIILTYLYRGKTEFKVKLRHYVPKFKEWGEIYRVGGPHMLMSLVGSVSMAFVIRVASPFGENVVAAYGILFRVFQFGFLPCIGIATGALPLIGYNYGARNYLRVRGTVRRTLLVSTAITTGVALIALIFPRAVVSVFNRDPEFLPLAAHAMRIAFIGFPFVGAQIAFGNFFQGTGKGLPSAIIGMSRQLLLLVPAVYIFARLFGQEGLWFAIPLSDILAFVFAAVWVMIAMYKMGIGLWGKCKVPQKATG